MVDRRGEEEQFTYDHIMDCMKKGMLSFFLCCENFKDTQVSYVYFMLSGLDMTDFVIGTILIPHN